MAETPPLRSALLVASYVPLLGFVALAAGRRDREIRWHAKNGLALFAAAVAVGIAATLVSVLFPSLGCVYGVAMLVAGTAYCLLVILAVVKALSGERLIVPGLSRYAR
jgi:uncharacterized membrane protein